MRFNVTYFRNDFEDKQESFVALDPDTKTVATIFDNAASVIYQGIEVEVQYVFNEYLRGFLNYGRLDADYDEFETDINPNDAETIIEDASFESSQRRSLRWVEHCLFRWVTVTLKLSSSTRVLLK